jgi:hypothetical protein
MRVGRAIAISLAVILLMSVSTLAFPVQAQGNIRTQITLGLKKDFDGQVTGDPDQALPSLVRVGETYLIYGRLMQLPDGRNLQALAAAEVKLVDVFNNAQNPIVLATARTDNDGFFVFEWKVSAKQFKELGVYKLQEGITSLENLRLQILGVFEGDSSHAGATSRGYIVNLKPIRLNVSIKTDKQLYALGESAKVTITFMDPTGQLTDPDLLEVFFDSAAISPVRQDIGTYFLASPPLSENIHKVTVLFDKEDYLREIITSTVTSSAGVGIPVNLKAELDQTQYGLGDFIEINGTVAPVIEGRLVLINVLNPSGSLYDFGHVSPNAEGTFKHQFRLVGPLATVGQWSVTYTYLGMQTSDSFSVRESPTKMTRVSVESSSIVNDIGEPIEEVVLGSPTGIQVELSNKQREEVALTYIVQIKDSQGFTVLLSWIKGIRIMPDTSTKPAIFWIPEHKGEYTVEIFAWESLENPMPLSPPESLQISVA